MSGKTSMASRAAGARARRSGDPAGDLIRFVRLLRDLGVAASPGSSLTATRAVAMAGVEQAADFRAALGCSLTHSVEERAVFEAVFDLYWSAGGFVAPVLPDRPDPGSNEDLGDAGPGNIAGHGEPIPRRDRIGSGLTSRRATYSPDAAARRPPIVAAELREIRALALRLTRTLASSPGRRMRAGGYGGRVDLRRSLRSNLRFGDELVELCHTVPRRDRARVVVLCDVSTSMQPYTPLFLAFIHALTGCARRSETAVFNVEVSMVSDVLRRARLREALAELRRREVELSGGTRIGHCLQGFLDLVEARGALRPRTTALILSDGWDVGEPELLERGMRRLRDQVDRVLWCDPHAAATGNQPQVRGLQVALPFVDDYLNFEDVSSLRDLVGTIENPARARLVGVA